jgi:hypothetical protein
MRLLLLLSVSLLLAGLAAHAQSADDYFNGGAHAYISNNIPQALGVVESGLKQYPDDVKLKKLYELLKQQSQQSSQNNQSQQNQKQQSQSNQSQPQKSNSRQNQQSSQQNAQPQDQNQQNPSGQKNAESQKPQPPQKPDEKQNDGKPENQNGQGQPVTAGQMTPEDAKRLLDAQKGDEQFLQLKPQGKPRDNQQPVKDW